MGDGTKENPFTREDVEARIKENGGTAEGLDLSQREFERGIDLHALNLERIILTRANLREARMEGANLRFAHLEGVDLRDAHLERADLRNTRSQEARLRRAQLQEANLTRAHLEGAILRWAYLDAAHLRYIHLEGADLRDTHLERADLRNADLQEVRLQHAQLQEANLTRSNLEGANLHETEFSDDTNFVRVYWGDYIIGEERKEQFLRATDIYRRLKQWHTIAGMYDIAGKFYYREREASRKGARHWNDRAAGWLSWAVFGHGEGWKRILFWIAGFILLFALTYYAIGSIWDWSAFGNSLYFSAVSFTALGYGSWVQVTNNWIKGLGAFESLVGISMMALLLVTFVRKWTR